jgi:hypothetical protein
MSSVTLATLESGILDHLPFRKLFIISSLYKKCGKSQLKNDADGNPPERVRKWLSSERAKLDLQGGELRFQRFLRSFAARTG